MIKCNLCFWSIPEETIIDLKFQTDSLKQMLIDHLENNHSQKSIIDKIIANYFERILPGKSQGVPCQI